MHTIVALWAHPRSLSTALERVFIERGDFRVLHEPFSYLYYVYEQRTAVPFLHDNPDHPRTYDAIKRHLLASAEKAPVLFKDMGYHCYDHVIADDDFLRQLVNTFIIRDPAKSIPSAYALNPAVTLDEIGYEQACKLFLKIMELTGEAPPVVDADDLQRDAAGMVRAYCAAIGVAAMPEALRWEAGHRPEWNTWREWHTHAAQSTRIHAQTRNYTTTVHNHAHLRTYYDYHLPYYETMHQYRLRAR
jgi:hypothetical protein